MGVDLIELRHNDQSFGEEEGLIPLPPWLPESAIQRETTRLFRLLKKQWGHQLTQADVDALVEHNKLWNFTRVPRTEEQREIVKQKIAAGGNSWLPESNGYVPTAQEVNDWALGCLGHGGCSAWICIEARCKREGVESTCPECEGEGVTWLCPEDKQLCEEWEPTEPPEGPGYQLWETTSEGSPVSPVFTTLRELCCWAENNYTTFGNAKATADQWYRMFEDNFVYHREGNAIFI